MVPQIMAEPGDQAAQGLDLETRVHGKRREGDARQDAAFVEEHPVGTRMEMGEETFAAEFELPLRIVRQHEADDISAVVVRVFQEIRLAEPLDECSALGNDAVVAGRR